MSTVWDRTAAFLQTHLRAIFAIAAIALFLPSAADAVLRIAALNGGAGAQLGVAIVSLAFTVLSLLGQLALVMLVLDPALGVAGSFRAAGPRLPILIGISVLLVIALLVALLPLIGILVADGVGTNAFAGGPWPELSGASIAAILLYVFVGGPLLLWIGTRLTATTPVIAAERRGLGALRRSFVLTRRHAARIFGTLLLIVVVGGVAALAVRLVVGIVLRLLIHRTDGFDIAAALTAVAVAVVTAALTAVLTVFATVLYQALRARHEAVPAR